MRIEKIRTAFIASVVLIGLWGSAGANAAIDTFLKIDGIDGESADAKHKNEIDVFTWSWSVVGTAAGKRGCIRGMSITKLFDSASPKLITSAGTGTTAPKAVLTVRKAGGQAIEFLVITMSNVLVSTYNVAGPSPDGLFENVTLSFELIEGAYKRQNPDGTLSAPIPWNIGPSVNKCAAND